jgi:hypothetical protein
MKPGSSTLSQRILKVCLAFVLASGLAPVYAASAFAEESDAIPALAEEDSVAPILAEEDNTVPALTEEAEDQPLVVSNTSLSSAWNADGTVLITVADLTNVGSISVGLAGPSPDGLPLDMPVITAAAINGTSITPTQIDAYISGSRFAFDVANLGYGAGDTLIVSAIFDTDFIGRGSGTVSVLNTDYAQIASSYTVVDGTADNGLGGTGVAVTLSIGHAPGKSVAIEGASKVGEAHVVLSADSTIASQRFRFVPDGSGYYTIVNINSGLVLDIYGNSTTAGAQVIQWPAKTSGGDNQKWIVTEVNGGYNIASKLNPNLVLDVYGNSTAEGANLILWNKGTNKPNQTFSLHRIIPLIENGAHSSIRPIADFTLSLDIFGSSQANGAEVILWTATPNKPNQQFTFAFEEATGYYTITTGHSNQRLDVYGSSTAAGAQVIQWPAKTTLNQRWAVVDEGLQGGSIRSALTGYALDVYGNNLSAGTQVIMWPFSGNSNQYWYPA